MLGGCQQGLVATDFCGSSAVVKNIKPHLYSCGNFRGLLTIPQTPPSLLVFCCLGLHQESNDVLFVSFSFPYLFGSVQGTLADTMKNMPRLFLARISGP